MHRPGFIVLLACAGLALAGCTGDGEPTPTPTSTSTSTSTPRPQELTTRGHSQSVEPVATDGPYGYAPSVMLDGGEHRMWWCSQSPHAGPAGDDVFFGSSPRADGPFVSSGQSLPTPVLSGNVLGGFDSVHTCDPSVVRVGGVHYLYYTGSTGGRTERGRNSIGVATSTDGLTWTRSSGSGPVVIEAGDVARDNTYGIGQPAAAHLDGWFYVMFTDTSAEGAGRNGQGQFVLRSRDPRFARGVEELRGDGFAPASPGGRRAESVLDAFSVDLAWYEALDAWGVAHEVEDGTQISFFSRDFTERPYEPILVEGEWTEGPGLLRTPAGHAPLSRVDPCGTVPVDVYRSTAYTPSGAPTDIRRFGTRITGLDACTDTSSTLRLLEGTAVPVGPDTYDVVVDGRLVRATVPALAHRLAGQVLEDRPSVLDDVPVTATLSESTRAVRSQGRVGLVLSDGRLWPLRHEQAVVELLPAPVRPVTSQQWDAYQKGPALG